MDTAVGVEGEDRVIRVQTKLAAAYGPIAVLVLTYGLLTGEYLEMAAGLAMFGLAAGSLGIRR